MTLSRPVCLLFSGTTATAQCRWRHQYGDGYVSGQVAAPDTLHWRAQVAKWCEAGCDGIVSLSHGGLHRLSLVTSLPIYVCSPRLFAVYMAQPAGEATQLSSGLFYDALIGISRAQNPPSTGGLRALSLGELVAYQLYETRTQAGTRALLQTHPAWPALCLARDTSPEVSTRQRVFTMRMLDPRNYVDINKPDRMAALRRHYRVTPAAMWQLRRGEDTAAARLLDCVGRLFAGSHWLTKPQDLVDVTAADNVLLWSRVCDLRKRHGSDTIQRLGQNSTELCRWWLGGAQLYLRFARDVWLDSDLTLAELALVRSAASRTANDDSGAGLTSGQRRRQLFVPAHYFSDDTALAAWNAHVAACRAVVE